MTISPTENHSKQSIETELISHGYLVLQNLFRKRDTQEVLQVAKKAFAGINFESTNIHKTFSVSDVLHKNTSTDLSIEYKKKDGYESFMMTYDLTAHLAISTYTMQQIEYGPDAKHPIIEASNAFRSTLKLFETQSMKSIFSELEPGDKSYIGILLNHSEPYSKCFGSHYELHRDDHYNSIVFSVQLNSKPTQWNIGRNVDSLDLILQDQGSMIVMDSFDSSERISPWHTPIIDSWPRNAVVVVCQGTYRERFMDWLAESGSAREQQGK